MEVAANQPWLQEKQVAEPAIPEVYNNNEKEHRGPQNSATVEPAMPEVYNSNAQEHHFPQPGVYHNNDKEHHVPQYDTAEKQAVNAEFNENPAAAPVSNKKDITLSRKTLIICAVVLILLIGALVGGLVGGLKSKQHSSVPQTSSSSTIPSSGASTSAGAGSSSSTPTTSSQPSATKASVATSAAAPASYPSILSTANLVQNPIFTQGLQYWSDPQHCWATTQDPSTDAGKIARVYDNDANPGNPCSLTQTISTVGAGSYMLAFLWGTYANSSAEATEWGGQHLTVRAGGSSSPAVIIDTTFSVPGRYDGFPVGSFAITTYEEDFIIDFSGWSNGSVWDIARVQLTRA